MKIKILYASNLAPRRIKCPRLWHQVNMRTDKLGRLIEFIDYYCLPPYCHD
jgi:hypothetical protein